MGGGEWGPQPVLDWSCQDGTARPGGTACACSCWYLRGLPYHLVYPTGGAASGEVATPVRIAPAIAPMLHDSGCVASGKTSDSLSVGRGPDEAPLARGGGGCQPAAPEDGQHTEASQGT